MDTSTSGSLSKKCKYTLFKTKRSRGSCQPVAEERGLCYREQTHRARTTRKWSIVIRNTAPSSRCVIPPDSHSQWRLRENVSMCFEQCRASVAQWSLREHCTKSLLCARPWGLERCLAHYCTRSEPARMNANGGTPAVCLGTV